MIGSMTRSDTSGLLERAGPLELLDARLRAVRADGRGRLVLVSGEAGIGKSALVREFCDRTRAVRTLWGGCDALQTPRALGPFVDIAEEAGGELSAVVGRAAAPGAVVRVLGRELREGLAIVVLEDLHWADEATLDVLRLIARRIESMPTLIVATFRDDEVHGSHPLRIALGDLPVSVVDRVVLAPLSVDAVATLAGSVEVDAGALHRRTCGNPFFVTEVLAAQGGAIPDTVRDAVLARAARLDDGARMVLDAVAIEPARAEVWLLEGLADGVAAGLDVCLATGMLRAERNAVSFRHEIARAAIEDALPPHRRILLHRRALGTLTVAIGRRPDLARLAHHAEAADDVEAVLRFAPAAAERAAALGSHREAASQFARAVRYAGDLPHARRAELLERRSYECYLTSAIAEALAARAAAMAEHRAAGDRLREGDAHRWLSRLTWLAGENARAEEEARLAIELLEPLGPGRELAMAYSNIAQLRMLNSDDDDAIAWGERAIALAERLNEPAILAHALNNVGSAERQRSGAGEEKLERSLELALAGNLEEHVARAYTNLGAGAVLLHDYPTADRHLDAGIAYCADRDLDAWLNHMLGFRARSRLDQGRWDEAAAAAAAVLADPRVPMPSRVSALVVVGSLRARRGDPDPWSPLDEARAFAESSGELQHIGPVAVARAEARWIAGEAEAIGEETAAALVLALERRDAWVAGELCVWRARSGLVDRAAPEALAAPCRLELDGAAERAAELWTALGCPFEAALALAHADAEDSQRRALAELQRLGARPAAGRVARMLRERGARDVRQGPRAATRENPGGLTARELEVLALLAEGLRNAEIATRLSVSQRTVAHHVSAILRKLDARTRSQAAAAAARLGVLER
jgi:DNA-binding CsgD family transcriptional regulator